MPPTTKRVPPACRDTVSSSLGKWTSSRAGRGNAGAPDVFVTRLHVRYDAEHFPDDLVFQQTGDRSNFQGRYILRHAWTGSGTCPAAADYRLALAARYEQQAQNLASLTGWDLGLSREKMGTTRVYPTVDERPWWQRLWKR